MKILAFGGALRTGSSNKKFAAEALRVAKTLGAEGEYIDLRDYPMPVYDGDIEANEGIPENTKKLSAKIKEADAIIISTPEYNASIPGMLKNVIDWLSRDKPVALTDKHLLLLAASPGALGGVRVLWNARQPFEQLAMHVYPGMMGLSDSANSFDESGKLKDEKKLAQLTKLLEGFIKHVKR